jgi:flagellar hook-associated protein 2
MSNISISGAVSGLDTASLINQLIAVDAQSQTAIKTKQTAAQSAADAYTSLITSLKSLATQSAAIAKTSTWQGSTATSTSTSVSATATGSAQGSITFDVKSLAAAHTVVSDNSVASTGSVVAGSSIDVLDGSGATKGTIDVGNGTLDEVVAGINGSSLGLRAAAVQTAPGAYRLQVTSATAGSASAFSLDGVTGFDGMSVLTEGTDASLLIGANPATQYTVTSSSNTFTDLVPGITFSVGKVEDNVTVSAKVDGTAVAAQISSLVDATNAALDTLSKQTAYDFTKKTGAALYGDSGIRSLQQQILTSVGGSSAPGIQLTRDGKLSFDKDAFLKAFVTSPANTAAAYGATSSFTPNTGVLGKASLLTSATGTRPGTYNVTVSVASAKETWQTTPTGSLAGQTFALTQGSKSASYTVGAGETLAGAAASINKAAAAAGFGTTASVDGSSIVFTANSAGTASAFSVTLNGAAGSQLTAGRDVVGTIDGQAASGTGDILTLTSKTSNANGLSLLTGFSDTDVSASGGAVGSITYKPGLAQKLSTLLNDATNTTDGALTRAQQSRVDDVKDLQSQIDDWDLRLAARRDSLQKQFTAMETAISTLKNASSSLSSLLGTAATSASSTS